MQRSIGRVFGRRLDGPVKMPVDYDVAGAAAGTNDRDLQDRGKLEYQGLKGPFSPRIGERGPFSWGGIRGLAATLAVTCERQ